MVILVPGVVFFFCYFVSGYTFSSNGSTPYEVPIQGSRAIVKEMVTDGDLVSPRGYGYEPLPDYLRVPAAEDFKSLFSPSLGSSDVPDDVIAVLSATPAPVTPDPYAALVKVVCRVSSFFVRVSRGLFTNRLAVRFLKLGLCRVNRRSLNYFYFFYRPSSDCGFTRTVSGMLPFRQVHYWYMVCVVYTHPLSKWWDQSLNALPLSRKRMTTWQSPSRLPTILQVQSCLSNPWSSA